MTLMLSDAPSKYTRTMKYEPWEVPQLHQQSTGAWAKELDEAIDSIADTLVANRIIFRLGYGFTSLELWIECDRDQFLKAFEDSDTFRTPRLLPKRPAELELFFITAPDSRPRPRQQQLVLIKCYCEGQQHDPPTPFQAEVAAGVACYHFYFVRCVRYGVHHPWFNLLYERVVRYILARPDEVRAIHGRLSYYGRQVFVHAWRQENPGETGFMERILGVWA
ncbi:uncharacterized protein BO66DRAFT_405522 [Aspergillus aculeatinus CBS 121060]|uniref:Uncharacterized protein n=1 Tax=Aspergillus aculeatinus CBS 121060 TaxID=1448322 RepID=A0ACD1GWB0_9EURO|nr:hypothetical protein BO66DRAFT_405522 [Aspergillus aculeatinus CBS 121060]RAH65497.1 hypothetical protein BO66DRAFT_405522 [Aspergillus aculeatinus CBS 121060]